MIAYNATKFTINYCILDSLDFNESKVCLNHVKISHRSGIIDMKSTCTGLNSSFNREYFLKIRTSIITPFFYKSYLLTTVLVNDIVYLITEKLLELSLGNIHRLYFK